MTIQSLVRLLAAPAALVLTGGWLRAQAPDAGEVAHGKSLFLQNCALCHSTGQPGSAGGVGPVLGGVAGRPAASYPNFGYSEALQQSHLTWDAASLDRYLAAPGRLVPGTTMVVAVASDADRRDLIAYLQTLPAPARNAAPVGPHPRTAGDWQNDAPGKVHATRVEDLPAPYATTSAGNPPRTVERPAGAALAVPAGFGIKLFAEKLSGPRLLRTAPNGDLFIAETRAGRIRLLRAPDGADHPTENTVFASGLQGPFGIAFHPAGDDPQWVYVGNLNAVVRFPYRRGDLQARGPAEVVVPHLSDTTGGHTTRDLAFSPDGRVLYISIGSGSNVADRMGPKSAAEIREWEKTHALGAGWDTEALRADIVTTDPEGKTGLKIYATGIRNAVGIAIQPGTPTLWASTNERDSLGDDLVPDYITRVRPGGYYGWPWYYLGNHEDPRRKGERPDLAGRAIVPDVLIQAHSASLEMTFYPPHASGPAAFPAEYHGDIFAALHGSWNRTGRTGAKIIRVHLRDGAPQNQYEDFVTGFVIDDGHVWGRPVGVTVAHDGALIFTDDAHGTVWRVAPTTTAPGR